MTGILSTQPRFSPRLVLRPFRRRDVGPIDEAVRQSLPELAPWLPWAGSGYSRSVAQRFVRDSISSWNEGKAWDFAIRFVEGEPGHVGNVSVWFTSRQNGIGEVGYWIRSDLTRRGLGTEATARVLEVAFDELQMHKVMLRIAVGNEGSERLAQKLGFLFEGTLREEVKVGSRWLDHTVWSLLDREYRLQRDHYRTAGWV